MKLTAKLLKKLIQEEVQKEGHYHDMGDKDEMYNALDMPKRLSPKEIFGEFQNFVELNGINLNGISMEQPEAMALLQQFMKKYSVDAEEVSNMADMMKDENPLNESPDLGNINIENVMLVLDALKYLGMIGVASLPIAMKVTQMIDPATKPKDYDPDEDETKRIAKRQKARRQNRMNEEFSTTGGEQALNDINNIIEEWNKIGQNYREAIEAAPGLADLANDITVKLGQLSEFFNTGDRFDLEEQLAKIVAEELEQIVSENQDSDFSDLEQKVIAYIKDNPEKLKQLNVDPREVDRSLGYENEDFLRLAKMLNIPNIDLAKLIPQMLVKKINNTFKQYTDGYIGYEDARGYIELNIAGDPAFKDEKQIIKTALNGLDSKAKARGDLDSEEDIEFEPMMENEEVSDKIKNYINNYIAATGLDLDTPEAGYPPKPMAKRWTRKKHFVDGLKAAGASWPKHGYIDWITDLFIQMKESPMEEEIEHKGHGGGLKLTKEQLTKIVAEELEKAKDRLIDRALDVEKKGHGSEMSAEKQAEFKSWASRQSEETLRDYINKHK